MKLQPTTYKLIIPLLLLAASLGLLLFIQKTPLTGIYFHNPLAHSFILLAFTATLFFIWFLAYQRFVRDKDLRWYFLSVAFFIRGVFAFAHAVLVPAFGWGNEALFDISEHYGLFLASLLLWGLVIPFSDRTRDKIYQSRARIFFGLNAVLAAGFAVLFLAPFLREALYAQANFFIALTGMSLFILLLVLISRREDNFFTSSLPKALVLLAAATLPPLFYQEWNITWWYFHLLEFAALLLLLRAAEGTKKQISEILFSSFSIRTRLFFIIGLTLVAIVVNGLIDFRLSQNHLKSQTMDNLVLIADMQEGQVLNWLETLKQRTEDFSSDGFIRLELAKILSGDRQAVSDLSRHLVENKQPLDPAIFGIHIMDINGKVVASSRGAEVGGEDMAMDGVFMQARGARYAGAYLSDITEDTHFGAKNIAILATAPIIDQTRQENIGVIMLFFKTQGLSDILTGKAQTKLGALSTWFNRKKTMEMYLVNGDKLMVSESRFILNAPFRQKVDTLPVRLCGKSEEMIGEYLDYRQIPVFGASMCFGNGWTLLTEIDKDEVLASLGNYLEQNLLSGTATFLLIFIAMYLFSLGIITPLKELSTIAQKLGKGDFTARAKLVTRDEFGELSQVFNQMAENIQKGNAGLEVKVKEEEISRLAIGNILGDLEEEKKKAEIFSRDLEKFKMATESTSDMVVISDPEGAALYANPAAEAITGYTAKEVIGKKCGLLWGGHMEPSYYKGMWQTIKVQKKTFVSKIRNKRKNGEFYDAAISISPVLDQKGDILFFVDTSRDITKEVEIDKEKTEFVSLASHQLKTPIGAISWDAEMLLSGDYGALDPEKKEVIEQIYHTNMRMKELVNGLLNISRINLGTFIIEPKPVNFAEVCDDVLMEMEPRILGKKHKIMKKYEKGMPAILADPNLLRIIFQNFISNAVKYTPAHGKVVITIATEGGEVVLRVANNGAPIPKEDQPKLFTKLFRASNAQEQDPDGNGLGLYLVKAIVENGGGRIWFESAEGKDTVFSAAFPLSGMKKKDGSRSLS